MTERIVSLNNVPADFSIEELEPRMEMQILGISALPGIRRCRWLPGGTRTCTTWSYTTVVATPGGYYYYRHVV